MRWKRFFSFGCAWFTIIGGFGVASAYEVAEVTKGGSITGRIDFEGVPPAPKRFEVKKNPDICGAERWLTKVEVHDSHLKGAVVMLQGVQEGKPFEARSFRGDPPGEGEFRYNGGKKLSLTIQAKSCNFGPFTGVLTSEELVRFVNQDSIKHTVHSYTVRGKKVGILRSVNIRELQAASEFEERFTEKKLKKGRVVAITCDRHDFMENRFYVVENPYFSISDKDGQYTIAQVPPGSYDLVVWHPVLGMKKQEVTVEPNGIIERNFEFSKK